ncbi:hypothetical protein OG384_04465 [Streptomyces sp. NBC_01324]|nr:hypothetical protein OG384_04465 [Streptomyces sp. NBC_01324]
MADEVQRPRPNPIIDEPATPTNCQQDYDAGADVRAAVARQEQRAKR